MNRDLLRPYKTTQERRICHELGQEMGELPGLLGTDIAVAGFRFLESLYGEPLMATRERTRTDGAQTSTINRETLIRLLNEDLAREYQAVIAYVVYSQVLKGAAYMSIAEELELHASEELSHALIIAKQIDYLGGEPTVVPKPVKMSEDPLELLRFDLENETETIRQYRDRVTQCEALGEFAMSEHIREILKQEQEHLIDLATALGEDPPKFS